MRGPHRSHLRSQSPKASEPPHGTAPKLHSDPGRPHRLPATTDRSERRVGAMSRLGKAPDLDARDRAEPGPPAIGPDQRARARRGRKDTPWAGRVVRFARLRA
ncbi:hypothetical protein GCM10011583_70860 [Streptomyces camponoticapitis]|uniref:Uncharacterized protein n=1 Tax=Streptomyces camponoticapitis TaxID=1616125 RepID=A0ABQ2EZ00_9ACTN|nr:hypothetical protein GCM10011583_70860 [Streptomyces camponoticapitis]